MSSIDAKFSGMHCAPEAPASSVTVYVRDQLSTEFTPLRQQQIDHRITREKNLTRIEVDTAMRREDVKKLLEKMGLSVI